VRELYRVLRRLLGYIKPHRWTIVAGSLLALVSAAAGGVVAWLVKPVMDDIFLKHDRVMLILVPLALLGVYVVKSVARYGESYLMATVSELVIAQLRRDLYAHIQSMPMAFFASLHSGELRARVVTDVNRIARLTTDVFVNVVRQAGTMVALLVVMFVREPMLTLIAAAVFPVVAIVIRRLGSRLYRINRRAQERVAELFILLQESFGGAKIVKAFGREQLEQARFDALNDHLLRLGLKDVRTDQLSGPVLEVLAAFGVVGALSYGGARVLAGALTTGEFFSFTAAVMLLYRPVRELSRTINTASQSMSSVERVFEILDIPPAVSDRPGARPIEHFHDRIVFDEVSFRYQDSDGDVLQGISLTIHRGETVAFVGLSGAGKSTLMDLLPRFYDVTGGRITIDGFDLREVTVASLRGLIGLVSQDTFLFHETLEYNIAYGKAVAGRDEVERAARLAQAHDFIAALPSGYGTYAGERGGNLSGGQAQRVAIARAFLKNPPILILDEATSDLDAESESLVQEALARLMKGRTVLVIAHRLATVKNADRVVVVHDGRIAEIGRHEELLARTDGLYRRLAALQALGVSSG
jgi:subfamily B ATP-binding cassette protein MsbA